MEDTKTRCQQGFSLISLIRLSWYLSQFVQHPFCKVTTPITNRQKLSTTRNKQNLARSVFKKRGKKKECKIKPWAIFRLIYVCIKFVRLNFRDDTPLVETPFWYRQNGLNCLVSTGWKIERTTSEWRQFRWQTEIQTTRDLWERRGAHVR